jgi:hypothetical protein
MPPDRQHDAPGASGPQREPGNPGSDTKREQEKSLDDVEKLFNEMFEDDQAESSSADRDR